RFYRKAYTPDHMVISVAGNVDHAQVVRQIREVFADRLEPSVDAAPARPARKRRWKADTVRILSRATEQA
ncbi:MAG: insulinase family protein, partial [Actinomycetota bacterium]